MAGETRASEELVLLNLLEGWPFAGLLLQDSRNYAFEAVGNRCAFWKREGHCLDLLIGLFDVLRLKRGSTES